MEIVIQKKLSQWSNRHALLMLLACSLMPAFAAPLNVLLSGAVISFLAMIVICRRHWTPCQYFGCANWVTVLRLVLIVLIVLLFAERPLWIILFSLLVITLDGVDGWLARKYGLNSEFGEYFDKETDAFFMLVLCLLLYMQQRFALWILFPGLMRYLFVVFLMRVKSSGIKETQTACGKMIFVASVLLLIFCFTDYALIYRPLAIMMTLLLGYSFAVSIQQIYRTN